MPNFPRLVSLALLVGAASFAAGCEDAVPPVMPDSPPPPPPDSPGPSPDAPRRAAHQKATSFNIPHGELELPGPVTFEAGSATLSPESEEPLEFVNDFLEAKPD